MQLSNFVAAVLTRSPDGASPELKLTRSVLIALEVAAHLELPYDAKPLNYNQPVTAGERDSHGFNFRSRATKVDCSREVYITACNARHPPSTTDGAVDIRSKQWLHRLDTYRNVVTIEPSAL